MNSIIRADNLVKTYGATTALAGVSLAVSPGESVAIMGASGSGKTTLLHTLAGVITPDSGSVMLSTGAGTQDVARMSDNERSRLRRESFGFVFQQGLLLPELTALENVALSAMLTGASRTDAEARARTWLAQLGLGGMEDRRIGQLSGGQAQRVAIARAQVTGAPVVFADEPTGALDSRTSSEVMTALIAATAGQGRTLIVVTHDRTVATRCSRIIEMRDGRIAGTWAAPQAEGTPRASSAQPNAPRQDSPVPAVTASHPDALLAAVAMPTSARAGDAR